MSTQALLNAIAEAVANGETEFRIAASGQHDIGGPLWNASGQPIHILVTNPGQRAGAMCLPGTTVEINGSSPADVGWLNSGGTIVVRGDAGDTAGHCAAAGKIFIGGRSGTRTGSLMKHDPALEPPELWILQSVGSFSFEFMGGGRAVVCGHDSQTLPSIFGQRPCVGMVGGAVYFRGPVGEMPPDVKIEELSQEDIAWLDHGLDEFLESINQSRLKPELCIWRHWRKLVPLSDTAARRRDVSEFRKESWLSGGVFGDLVPDDLAVCSLTPRGVNRLRIPLWENGAGKCTDCRSCLTACPNSAVLRRAARDNQSPIYTCRAEKCSGCGFCSAVCPAGVWTMEGAWQGI